MTDNKKPDATPLEIARITSRWQIITALISVAAGLAIAILSNEAFFKATPPAVCNVIEVSGQYGDADAWEFEIDLMSGQFESENQLGEGRIDGTVSAVCDSDRFAARIEGRVQGSSAPVMCLFDGMRSGAEGRVISGRMLCDDAALADQANSFWQGTLALAADRQ